MTDPNLVFKEFAESVARDFPELRKVLDQAKDGTLSEGVALRALSELVMSNPDLGCRFQKAAMQALTPHDDPSDQGGLMLHKERGLPQINPLVEAALIERAQFDGDMPELRTGGMVRGQAPSVQIETTARSPLAIGQMIKQASEEIADKIAHQRADAMALTEQGQVDIPEYPRGAVPAPLHVEQPSGAALLALTPKERQQSAWAFLSTTQGRRSGVRGLIQVIESMLIREGFTVMVRQPDPVSMGILACHEWAVSIDGPMAMSPAFNLLDIAATSIAKGLIREMGDRRGRVVLEVQPINTVDVRTVGWAGRLLSGDTLLQDGHDE